MEITNNHQVDFDEFSRACDLVEAYFDELIEEVAKSAPVSQRQLVAVLARAQLTGRQRAIDGFDQPVDVVYQSNDETLCWFESNFWVKIRDQHQLTPDDTRAAREVHRQLIEAVDGDVPYYNRDRDPFVLIERQIDVD